MPGVRPLLAFAFALALALAAVAAATETRAEDGGDTRAPPPQLTPSQSSVSRCVLEFVGSRCGCDGADDDGGDDDDDAGAVAGDTPFGECARACLAERGAEVRAACFPTSPPRNETRPGSCGCGAFFVAQTCPSCDRTNEACVTECVAQNTAAFVQLCGLVQPTRRPTVERTPRPTDTRRPTFERTPRPTDTRRPTFERTPRPTDTRTPTFERTPRPTDTRRPTFERTPRPTDTRRPTTARPTRSPGFRPTQPPVFSCIQTVAAEVCPDCRDGDRRCLAVCIATNPDPFRPCSTDAPTAAGSGNDGEE